MTEMPDARQPEAPVALIRRAYAAFQVGDVAAVLDCFAPDAVFDTIGDPPLLPYCGRWIGQAGLLTYFTRIAQTAEVLAFEPEQVTLTAEGGVLATGREHLRFRTTGMEVRSRWVHLFHVAGGRITAGAEWSDTAAQLVAYRGY